MQIWKVILLFCAALAVPTSAASSGWQIPEGQPDGIYQVHTDDQGNHHHKLIKLHDPAPIRGPVHPSGLTMPSTLSNDTSHAHIRNAIVARDTTVDKSKPGIFSDVRFFEPVNKEWKNTHKNILCATEKLDINDLQASEADLDLQCGDGRIVQRKFDIYSIRGCVVSYYCNFSWLPGRSYYRNKLDWDWVDGVCMKSERQKWTQQVDDYCGAGVAGWVTDVYNNNEGDDLYPAWNSYGRESSCVDGKSFCGRHH